MSDKIRETSKDEGCSEGSKELEHCSDCAAGKEQCLECGSWLPDHQSNCIELRLPQAWVDEARREFGIKPDTKGHAHTNECYDYFEKPPRHPDCKFALLAERESKANECPVCGHSAYNHWKRRSGMWDDATKGQNPHILKKYRKQDGTYWSEEYESNCSPGNLPEKGCFKAISEHWRETSRTDPNHVVAYNYYEFCDCPIDRNTVLTLIRQGKVSVNPTEATFDGESVLVDAPVIIFQEDGYWLCQGYGFDYLAQGDTREQAIAHFAEGLRATFLENGRRGLNWK